MIDQHTEIEAKLDARTISHEEFVEWVVRTYGLERFKHVSSPDTYYEQGDNVVRQRGGPKDVGHELTVKRRRSQGSTRDRLEIDLKFDQGTSVLDVRKFLDATGFKQAFSLHKEAWVCWVRLTDNVSASLVYYEVWREDEGRSKARYFVEAEIEKGSDVTPDTAKRHLRSLVDDIRNKFRLDEPLNESLWEIFSGKRYQEEA